MQLYFSPLACSMASRITLYEAGGAADYVEVDPRTKRTRDGVDYLTINPLGLVPALRTDAGEVLLENGAILQHLADLHPDAGLAPRDGFARARLQQWLSFIGTELHKALFMPLFDKGLADSTRAKTLETGATRLAYLDRHLAGRELLLDGFSIADAYLVTVLNWKVATPVALEAWPAIEAYFARVKARPAVARAMQEEGALYAAEQKRHQAA
ncbi:MAG: glutathione S-transferase N-terminal domain-containing protein [Hyphomicrobiaceae bacterium]|nr:glutathione S-transferase N-terminal domain-containing protein [Hyphomicrobiaceae bacterium]